MTTNSPIDTFLEQFDNMLLNFDNILVDYVDNLYNKENESDIVIGSEETIQLKNTKPLDISSKINNENNNNNNKNNDYLSEIDYSNFFKIDNEKHQNFLNVKTLNFYKTISEIRNIPLYKTPENFALCKINKLSNEININKFIDIFERSQYLNEYFIELPTDYYILEINNYFSTHIDEFINDSNIKYIFFKYMIEDQIYEESDKCHINSNFEESINNFNTGDFIKLYSNYHYCIKKIEYFYKKVNFITKENDRKITLTIPHNQSMSRELNIYNLDDIAVSNKTTDTNNKTMIPLVLYVNYIKFLKKASQILTTLNIRDNYLSISKLFNLKFINTDFNMVINYYNFILPYKIFRDNTKYTYIDYTNIYYVLPKIIGIFKEMAENNVLINIKNLNPNHFIQKDNKILLKITPDDDVSISYLNKKIDNRYKYEVDSIYMFRSLYKEIINKFKNNDDVVSTLLRLYDITGNLNYEFRSHEIFNFEIQRRIFINYFKYINQQIVSKQYFSIFPENKFDRNLKIHEIFNYLDEYNKNIEKTTILKLKYIYSFNYYLTSDVETTEPFKIYNNFNNKNIFAFVQNIYQHIIPSIDYDTTQFINCIDMMDNMNVNSVNDIKYNIETSKFNLVDVIKFTNEYKNASYMVSNISLFGTYADNDFSYIIGMSKITNDVYSTDFYSTIYYLKDTFNVKIYISHSHEENDNEINLINKEKDVIDKIGNGQIEFKHYPVEDFTCIKKEYLSEIITLFDKYTDYNNTNPIKQGIIIHCGAGYGRTGRTILGFIIYKLIKNYNNNLIPDAQRLIINNIITLLKIAKYITYHNLISEFTSLNIFKINIYTKLNFNFEYVNNPTEINNSTLILEELSNLIGNSDNVNWVKNLLFTNYSSSSGFNEIYNGDYIANGINYELLSIVHDIINPISVSVNNNNIIGGFRKKTTHKRRRKYVNLRKQS
jgi:hypothetical protein